MYCLKVGDERQTLTKETDTVSNKTTTTKTQKLLKALSNGQHSAKQLVRITGAASVDSIYSMIYGLRSDGYDVTRTRGAKGVNKYTLA